MRTYDRLSAQDASFLYAETPVAHMHVGSLVLFEDSGFAEEDLFRHIESRLHLVPRFRKKLAWAPMGGGRPIWVDDPHFDLRFHIRNTGLARPGGMPQLLKLMGRLMSAQLDRSRPLWEMWLVDLPDKRRAIIQKTHHCLIDGISGVNLGTVLLDLSPTPTPGPAPPAWKPEPEPTRWELFRDTWRRRLTRPSEMGNYIKSVTQERVDWERMQAISQGVAAFGKATLGAAPKTSLNAPIGPHRRFAIARAELSAVKAIKSAHDCKVNDVVLAVVAGALRQIFLSRGDAIDGLVLKAMVPVSVRDPSQRHTYGNMVSMMSADLPVSEPDPVQRLIRVRQHMAGIKESKQAVGADFWVKLAEFAPPTLVALASRAASFQRVFNLCVTNVPGPQFPLYLLGGRLLEVFPYVPLLGTVATSVAVMSYCGQLNFGLTGDWDVVPDLDRFADGIAEAIDQLTP